MKKSLNFIAIFMLFASISVNAITVNVGNEDKLSTENEVLTENEMLTESEVLTVNEVLIVNEMLKQSEVLTKQSCFSFMHDIYNNYFGGINLDNLADFNASVAYCQSQLE